MSDFTHLHVHSHYSLLDGLGTINLLVERAQELGMSALALTDHGVMHGAVEFYKAATEAGIKPILGVEAYLAPQGHTSKRGKFDSRPRHLTLLAQNNQGYQNLMKLTTEAHLHGYYYKPRIDYELLERYCEGVIVLSGCLNGDIAKAIIERRPADAKKLIEWHVERFGKDRFYLEVQDHQNIRDQKILNEAVITYANEYGLSLVATCDSHYVRPEDAQAQDVLLCVQTGKTVDEQNRMSMLSDDFSLKSAEDVAQAWARYPQAVDNTMKIADMCSVDLEFGVHHLPRYPLPKDKTADQELRNQCLEGLPARYGTGIPEGAEERLDYELSVIEKTGFASYFLIVSDFVNEAKRRGILVGPGRGSAAGSLVAYLTNITNVDPLKYNLLFERFLNPERVSMPDIDLDFADDRRGEVIDYVREKYGQEYVAQIITFGTMAARAAVRDAGRALGFPYAFCDQLAKAIPPFMNFKEALDASSELKEMYSTDPQAKRLIDTAQKLEGVARHASTHAAAVVIGDRPLTDYVPLQLSSTSDGEKDTVTQYAMGPIEDLGLLKMDFLGLKNLTVIQRALDLIKKHHDVDIDLDTLPLDDAKAYALLQEGRTTGVFQLESSGMKRYLKELRPTELEDIISMVALYRPGPMDSIPDFIAAKHGKKKIQYLHPTLKPILERTYGIIVTQDQVLQIAREFAGFTYAEADILRKAVGKKIKKLLDEQREKFIKGAIEVKGIDSKTAAQVWDFIEPFARYGFNRAHAACYAMIAYQTAYLKANYPAEFMASLLTSDEGNTDRQAIEVADAIGLGLSILPPDVNESEHDFSVSVDSDGKPAIRFGLGAIKNVGHGAVEAIITERGQNGVFQDISDAFVRVSSRDFNRKSVESLARAGAFDSLEERNTILESLERLLEFNRAIHKQRDAGQQGLFGGDSAVAKPSIRLAPASPASKDDRLLWEKELLGLYVSEHPLADMSDIMEQVATPIAELSELARDTKVRIAGIISKVNKIITKKGQPMLFVLIEDLTAKVEALVFPNLLEKTADLWSDGAKIVVEGTISDKDGELKMLSDNCWQLTRETAAHLTSSTPKPRRSATHRPNGVSILVSQHTARKTLEQLKSLIATAHVPEGIPVELLIKNGGSLQKIATQYRIVPDSALKQKIVSLVGTNALHIRQ